jgi:tetratricopeptide (TPR) repeat protein
LAELAIARQGLPDDSDLWSLTGHVRRRQGKFEEALANIKRAYKLDPRSSNIIIDLGETLTYMRNYAEAMHYFERAIALAPDEARPYGYKASLHLLSEGSIEKARAVMEEARRKVRAQEESLIVDSLIDLDVYAGNYEKALDRLSLQDEDIESQDFFARSQRCAFPQRPRHRLRRFRAQGRCNPRRQFGSGAVTCKRGCHARHLSSR